MATILDPDDVALAAILADAGRILGSSLDSAATLRQIADLIVPAMADWCAIDLLDADGNLVPLALAHRDPERTRLVEELRTRYPPTRAPRSGHTASPGPGRRHSSRSSTRNASWRRRGTRSRSTSSASSSSVPGCAPR